jgi:hypothetical protein
MGCRESGALSGAAAGGRQGSTTAQQKVEGQQTHQHKRRNQPRSHLRGACVEPKIGHTDAKHRNRRILSKRGTKRRAQGGPDRNQPGANHTSSAGSTTTTTTTTTTHRPHHIITSTNRTEHQQDGSQSARIPTGRQGNPEGISLSPRSTSGYQGIGGQREADQGTGGEIQRGFH